MRKSFLLTLALIAVLVHASVAHGQVKTAYSGEGTFAQIGQVSAWAPDQCENNGRAADCMKEALQLIHDMHRLIVRMGAYNLTPSAAERSAINSGINTLGNRIDKWGEKYHIRARQVSAK